MELLLTLNLVILTGIFFAGVDGKSSGIAVVVLLLGGIVAYTLLPGYSPEWGVISREIAHGLNSDFTASSSELTELLASR